MRSLVHHFSQSHALSGSYHLRILHKRHRFFLLSDLAQDESGESHWTGEQLRSRWSSCTRWRWSSLSYHLTQLLVGRSRKSLSGCSRGQSLYRPQHRRSWWICMNCSSTYQCCRRSCLAHVYLCSSDSLLSFNPCRPCGVLRSRGYLLTQQPANLQV